MSVLIKKSSMFSSVLPNQMSPPFGIMKFIEVGIKTFFQKPEKGQLPR